MNKRGPFLGLVMFLAMVVMASFTAGCEFKLPGSDEVLNNYNHNGDGNDNNDNSNPGDDNNDNSDDDGVGDGGDSTLF